MLDDFLDPTGIEPDALGPPKDRKAEGCNDHEDPGRVATRANPRTLTTMTIPMLPLRLKWLQSPHNGDSSTSLTCTCAASLYS
jgi:hypothetical protein